LVENDPHRLSRQWVRIAVYLAGLLRLYDRRRIVQDDTGLRDIELGAGMLGYTSPASEAMREHLLHTLAALSLISEILES
jgi:hypothetical protein